MTLIQDILSTKREFNDGTELDPFKVFFSSKLNNCKGSAYILFYIQGNFERCVNLLAHYSHFD